MHSNVINSYFGVFSKNQEKVLYCRVTEALLILHGKSFSRLWKNQPIQKDSVIINQLNITGLLSKLTFVTDLITSLILSKTILMRIAKHWWMRKFGLELNFFNLERIDHWIELNFFNLERIDHPLPSDFISCGDLIYYYTKRFTQGNAFCVKSTLNLDLYSN